MRPRYEGTFSLSRDTTTKEMLHCFALAYFAVCETSGQEPTIEGLVDALSEEKYTKYNRYISYPLTSSELKASQKDKMKTIYEAFPALNSSILNTLEELHQLKLSIKSITKKKVDSRTKKDVKDLASFKKKQEALVKKVKSFRDKKSSFVVNRTTSKTSFEKKFYIFTKDDIDALSWVQSAFWTAKALKDKNIITGGYASYIYCHSTSYHVRLVKDIPLTEACLRIIAENGINTRADMLNPSDIYAIKTSSFKSIIDSYKQETSKIINGEVSNATSFNLLTRRLITTKKVIPISLKKSTSANPTVHLTGITQDLPPELDPLVDEYTEVIDYFSSINDPSALKNQISTLVTINKIDYKHTIETFAVNFSFNYSKLSIPKLQDKNIVLSDEHYNLVTASMTWNALPTNKEGRVIGAYTGGAGFTLVADILKKYPGTKTIFNQIIEKRKIAFIAALASVGVSVPNNKLPQILNKQTIINESRDQEQIKMALGSLLPSKLSNTTLKNNVYGLYLVTLNSLLLERSITGSSSDDVKQIKEIWSALGEFASDISNEKIESLLPKSTRDAYNYGVKTQTGRQKRSMKQYAKITHQENRVAKLEALWFFMTGGSAHLNHYFKKQIALTIYGLITKKGSKIFHLEPNGVYKSGEKKGQNKFKTISDALGFRSTPYYLIGNSDTD